MYLCHCFLLQCVEVAESSNVCCNAPVVEVAGRFIQLLVLRHQPDDALLEPSWEGLDWLASYCGLSVDVEDMGSTSWTVAFGEPGDCAIVQQLDPFDGLMDAIAVADGESGEAFVLFIPWGYLFPSLLLELLKPLVKVSDGFGILLLFLVMDPVALTDGLYELFSEIAEPDWIVDVEPLDNVSGRGWGDGIDVRGRHEDSGRGRGGAI